MTGSELQQTRLVAVLRRGLVKCQISRGTCSVWVSRLQEVLTREESSLPCMHNVHAHIQALILYTHHRAHPLAQSQHVILMKRCGMPHYRHTQLCYYSTIDGPGAFFTSLNPPWVMLGHRVPAYHTTQQNTRPQTQHWLCWWASNRHTKQTHQ